MSGSVISTAAPAPRATSWSPPVIVKLDHRTSVGRSCTCSKYSHAHPAEFELRSYAYDVVTDGGDENGANESDLYCRLISKQASSYVCANRLLSVMNDKRWKGQIRLLGISPWVSMVIAANNTPQD